MGDDDHSRAAGGGPQNGLHQGGLAFLVEVGIGLVQHQQNGVPIERPGQGDALGLTGGKALAMGPEPGIVAVRQAQDQLMGPRRHGRLDRVPVGRFLIHPDGGRKPRDIVLDRAGEQAGDLGQIADPARQFVTVPRVILGAVEPYGAALRLEGPGDDPRKRGLARTA